MYRQLKKLFIKKKGNTTKYKFLGLTIYKKTKTPNKKIYKILGIKIAQKRKSKYIRLTFADNLKNCSQRFNTQTKFNRLAIFASFNKDGLILDYVVYYLTELKKVVDGIIFVTDNPILPSELDKIKDIIIYAECQRHEEYDFGSYKRGFFWAKENDLLADCTELILCNDSCFGPLYPFSEMFDTMAKRTCDFWGILDNTELSPHVQSYFLVIKKNIIQEKLHLFFDKIKHYNDVSDVIINYEVGFTKYLTKYGYKYQSYINCLKIPFSTPNKTVYPLYLVKKHSMPLIKIKALSWDWYNQGYSHREDAPDKIMQYLSNNNLLLYQAIQNFFSSKIKTSRYNKIISESGMWDEDFYSTSYNIPKEKALCHYIELGWMLGYNPSPFFDNNEYINLYNITECPLLHFITKGSLAGLKFVKNLHIPNAQMILEYQKTRKKRKTDKVIYTCLTGNYDNLINHYYINPDWDYICFTDNENLLKSSENGIWQIRKLIYSKLSPSLNNRWHKFFPQKCLTDYSQSIYIDSNINILSPALFNEINTSNKDILLPVHFNRKCIYEELEAVKSSALAPAPLLTAWKQHLINENFPKNFGLAENNIIYRKHHNSIVNNIMNDWWNILLQYAHRDQLSLMYLFWKNKIYDISSYFLKNTSHMYKDYRLYKHNIIPQPTLFSKKRLCLFAGYSNKGKIEDYVIYYLKELSKFADIHYLADCQMKESELEKIANITKSARAQRHEMYDFGSWHILFQSLSYEELYQYDELILANDSCYGPLFNLEDLFGEMTRRKVDFWGITENNKVQPSHLQSYFIDFSKNIFTSAPFINFMNKITKEKREDVVKKYEFQLTDLLHKIGWSYSSYINNQYIASSDIRELLKRKCPFIKVKYFTSINHTMKYYHDSKTIITSIQSFSDYNTELIKTHISYNEEYMKRFDGERLKWYTRKK